MKTSTKIFFAKYLAYFIRFFIKFLGKNAKKLIVKRNNIFFSLNLFEGIDFAVFLNFYEKNVVNFYSKIIKSSFVIVDIGSNFGFHTLNFSKLTPSGKVFSIEPTSFAYNKLKKNINLNPILKKNIVFDQVFLSRLNINLKNKYVYASWPLSNTKKKVHPILMGQEKKIQGCNVKSFDNYILRRRIKNLDMIKIDVDGNEYDIIKSGEKTIKKFKPIIMIEFCPFLHENKHLNFIINFFNKFNYDFIDSSNSNKLELKNVEDINKLISYGSSKNIFLIPK